MTVAQFQQHDYLPGAWAKELATNHILQKVMEVMNDNRPDNFAIQGDGNSDVSPTRAAIELGFTRGYSKYHETMLMLARRTRKSRDIGETTYDPPPKPEELQNA